MHNSELCLIRIDADDGMTATLEACSKFSNVFKLLIAVWAGVRRKHLVVDSKRVAHLVKQAGHGIG